MKKLLLAIIVLVFPSFQANAAEFTDKDSLFTVNVPSGWSQGASDNPAVSLRLEKGSSSIEFEKQEDTLSDYYLKSGVSESVETVRARGANFYGAEVNSVSIYGITNAYYTAYEAGGVSECAAYFTYNNTSFLMSAVGVSPNICRDVIASVCKPGTKCVPPCSPYNCLAPNFCKAGKCVAPPPCAPDNCPAPKMCRNNRCVNPPCSPDNCKEPKKCVSGRCIMPNAKSSQASNNEEENISFEDEAKSADGEQSGDVIENMASSMSEGAEVTGKAVNQVISSISTAGKKSAVLPKHLRKPLPFAIWGVLIALWFVGGIVSRGAGRLHKNPKLPPPPKEVPPDFFFPFVINTIRTLTRVQYNVATRQKQKLYGTYEYKYVPFLVYPIVALIAFHVAWSIMALIGKNEVFIGAICTLPFGRFIATFPELIFLVFIVIGIIKYMRRNKEFALYDSRQTLMARAVKEGGNYCIIYDGNGKQVASLVKESSSPRTWKFVDADDNVKFTLVDDAPKIYAARKLFGYQGGILRSRYGIFEQENRAGYTFMDPSSADRFQVHMDFAYSRIAGPSQILAAILFVVSYEKDSWYPTIL